MNRRVVDIPSIAIIFLSICLITSIFQAIQIKNLSVQVIDVRENINTLKYERQAIVDRIITESLSNNDASDLAYTDAVKL